MSQDRCCSGRRILDFGRDELFKNGRKVELQLRGHAKALLRWFIVDAMVGLIWRLFLAAEMPFSSWLRRKHALTNRRRGSITSIFLADCAASRPTSNDTYAGQHTAPLFRKGRPRDFNCIAHFLSVNPDSRPTQRPAERATSLKTRPVAVDQHIPPLPWANTTLRRSESGRRRWHKKPRERFPNYQNGLMFSVISLLHKFWSGNSRYNTSSFDSE